MCAHTAAYAVHSNIYTGSPKTLEKEGDAKLRGNFHDRMVDMLREYNFKPKRILDVGCSTGLSTLKLHATFPDAELYGIDLSPYMLSVARYNLQSRPEQAQVRGLRRREEGRGWLCLVCPRSLETAKWRRLHA
jgi:predicted O-methyltransferase YrrM